MRNTTFTSLNGADVTTATTGAVMFVDQAFYASAQVIMTGSSPTGVVKLQASNDPFNANVDQSTLNWSDIPSATVSVSSNTNYLIPKIDLSYNYLRAYYTKTSGTGTVTVNFVAMGN